MPVIHFIAHNMDTIIWVIVTMLVTGLLSFVTVLKLEEEIEARHNAEKKLKKSLATQKRLNTTIEKQKGKLEAILSSIGEGLLVVNDKGRVELINHIAGSLLRQVPDQVLGKNLFDIIKFKFEKKHKRKNTIKKAIAELVKKPDIITYSVTDHLYCETKDKKTTPIVLVMAPLFHGKDRLVIILLKDASKEASVDKAKTEFVSLASHQLRTPLSTMAWYTELMLEGDAGRLTKKQKSFLKEIHGSNKRMTELVNSLLNASRIDLGTYSVEPELIKISKVAKSVVKELFPSIKEKEINFKTNISKKIPEMFLDLKLIRIIFQNLLTNAVKYTPKQGNVSFKIGLKEKNKKKIIIEVRDDGMGIPKNEQNKIFSKLFRATNAQKRVSEGNGLGLYLVKSIIEQSNGKIWFDSREDRGTTFFVEIPLSGMKVKKGIKKISA